MAEPNDAPSSDLAPEPASEPSAEELGHPRGTLAVVLLYGLLFALGWLALYLFEFLPRGGPS